MGAAKTEQAVGTAIFWRRYSEEDLQDELRAGDECKVMYKKKKKKKNMLQRRKNRRARTMVGI